MFHQRTAGSEEPYLWLWLRLLSSAFHFSIAFCLAFCLSFSFSFSVFVSICISSASLLSPARNRRYKETAAEGNQDNQDGVHLHKDADGNDVRSPLR